MSDAGVSPRESVGSGDSCWCISASLYWVKPHLEFGTQVVRRNWNTSVRVLRSAGTGEFALSRWQGEVVPAWAHK